MIRKTEFHTRTALLLGASLLAAPGIAAAQDTAPEPVDECVDLYIFVDESDDYVLDDEPEIVALIEENEAPGCERALQRLQREASLLQTEDEDEAEAEMLVQEDEEEIVRDVERETETATRRVQEEVQIEETVTVQGVVDVASGVPTVEVDQQAAEVSVREQAPRVTVTSRQGEIVVREAPPRIRVEMPQPIITIEQDAPEIVITMPDPDVNVETNPPQVEVRQPEPRIRVAVPDPLVDLDLQAVAGAEDGEVETRFSRQDTPAPEARDGMRLVPRAEAGTDANVYVTEAEPNVEMAGGDAAPEISVETAEPSVRFVDAEPEIELAGEEPRVEYRRVGEPRVTFEQAAAPRQGMMDADEAPVSQAGAVAIYTVGDLTGMDVVGSDGDDLGTLSRFVRTNGQVYAILTAGGFLGLGEKEVPLPLSSLSIGEDEIIARGLTEDAIEEVEEQDIPSRLDLGDDEQIDID
ncbi:PRC-barrel domain-containing protein [Parvularcula oceani]|uniref:PRC-barrel domain-containing protein n=1 Tax=Parvularcula oceani TaxID=1247963 RepID=UPI0004E1C9C9|nr:PRC-barrel domain-containing protein [Parvularcula oceani]